MTICLIFDKILLFVSVLINRTEEVNVPALKGFKLTQVEKDMYEKITAAIEANTDEGDINGNGLASSGIAKHVCEALGIEIIPFYTQEDGELFFELIKSSIPSKKLYPKPELRVMGDADILIREEQYDKIKPVMDVSSRRI